MNMSREPAWKQARRWKRGKTQATKSQLVLVLQLIGWDAGRALKTNLRVRKENLWRKTYDEKLPMRVNLTLFNVLSFCYLFRFVFFVFFFVFLSSFRDFWASNLSNNDGWIFQTLWCGWEGLDKPGVIFWIDNRFQCRRRVQGKLSKTRLRIEDGKENTPLNSFEG